MVIASQWHGRFLHWGSVKNKSCIYIRAGIERPTLSQQWCHLQKKKNQWGHIWHCRVDSPDEKSDWIMMNGEIRACNIAAAIITQCAGLQFPHMTASWSLSWAKLWQHYIYTFGCWKSLMCFLSRVCSVSEWQLYLGAHVKQYRHEQRLNLSNLSAL